MEINDSDIDSDVQKNNLSNDNICYDIIPNGDDVNNLLYN